MREKMDAGDICNRIVTVADRTMPLVQAAQLMRDGHVGCLVVVDDTGAGKLVVGMLTDRDIVVAVVAMELDGRFHALYVHGCARTNQSPIVEFYDAVFDHVPQMAELADVRARGRRYNDGVGRVARFSISGLKFLPDPASQFTLVKACVETPPDPGHLQPSSSIRRPVSTPAITTAMPPTSR